MSMFSQQLVDCRGQREKTRTWQTTQTTARAVDPFTAENINTQITVNLLLKLISFGVVARTSLSIIITLIYEVRVLVVVVTEITGASVSHVS